MSLIPPGAYPTPSGRMFGFLFRRKPRPDIPWPPWRILRSGIGALRAVGRVHYKEPHYYLPVIGVHPDYHGKGLGGALVRHAVALADRDGVAIYLETANQSNLGFYRRFGFELLDEVETPGGGPPLWTMARPSAAGEGG
jgi:ribosomal protein S18 acetylase RimI-like enzyme